MPPRYEPVDLISPYSRWASPLLSRLGGNRYGCGTAFFVAWGVALTAWHNVRPLVEEVGGRAEFEPPHSGSGEHRIDVQIEAHQLVDDEHFVQWAVRHLHRCAFSPDIAILHLEPMHELPPGLRVRIARLDLLPPLPGQRVRAFGYPGLEVGTQVAPDGLVSLGIDPHESEGEVLDVYDLRRDSAMLPFPCFSVAANFEHGMSGGPVVNVDGLVCGVVSAGLGQDLGYGASLWPILAETVQWDGFNGGEPFLFFDVFVRPTEAGRRLGHARHDCYVKVLGKPGQRPQGVRLEDPNRGAFELRSSEDA